MTTEILDIISTREAALIFYLLLGIFLGLLIKDIRNSLFNLLRIVFRKKIGSVLLLQVSFAMLTIYFLYKLSFWNLTFLKDTMFWFFTSAVVTFFQINKETNSKFFLDICKDNLKWAVFINFLVNFYTFGIWTELILLPILFFLTAMSAVADLDKKNTQISNFLKIILGLIGLTFIAISFYKTFHDLSEFLTLHTLVEFLLPLILSLLQIPFFYALALCMQYETLFVRINFMQVMSAEKRKLIKKYILLTANISLNKISLISKHISKIDLHQSTDIKITIRTLLKTHTITDTD
jgi:hypothetical protein